MVDQKLVNYISQQLSYGYSYRQIKQALLRQGWPEAEIDEAINSVSGSERPIHRLKQVEKKPSHFNIILPGVIVIAVLGVGIFLIMPYLALPICGECQYLEGNECKNYVCCTDADCNDNNQDTVDTCENPSTLNARCSYNTPFTTFECKLESREGYEIVSGKVEFPRGIKTPQVYKALGYDMSETPISSEGEFCIYGPNDSIFLLGISSPNEEDFPLMAIVDTSQEVKVLYNFSENENFPLMNVVSPNYITVNSDSTAVAIVFATPFLSTNDPADASEILEKIVSNTEVKVLADEIRNKEELLATDIQTGPISEAFGEALKSVLDSIAESTDCGTDFDCFVDASYGCEQAKVLHTVTVNLFGMLSTFSYHMEFKGLESGKCIYYERIEDNTVKFSDELVQQMLDGGTTQEEIDQQEQVANENAQLTIGMERTCKFDTEDLNAMLDRWKQGSYSSEDFDVAECVTQQPSTNTSCTLQTAGSSIKLLKGVSSSCSVSGFQGSESDVSWSSEDTNIATVDPATGASTMIISQNTGTAQIIATDNAVGPDCTVSIEVTVESLY